MPIKRRQVIGEAPGDVTSAQTSKALGLWDFLLEISDANFSENQGMRTFMVFILFTTAFFFAIFQPLAGTTIEIFPLACANNIYCVYYY